MANFWFQTEGYISIIYTYGFLPYWSTARKQKCQERQRRVFQRILDCSLPFSFLSSIFQENFSLQYMYTDTCRWKWEEFSRDMSRQLFWSISQQRNLYVIVNLLAAFGVNWQNWQINLLMPIYLVTVVSKSFI